jgi:general secretion pathway protein K
MFSEVSELRAVSGMTPEIYDPLAALGVRLPHHRSFPDQRQHAGAEQAPLLAMLGRSRSASMPCGRAGGPPATGWNSMTDFWAQFQGVNLPFDVQLQPQLRTRWFSLDVLVEMEGAELQETALIDARACACQSGRQTVGERGVSPGDALLIFIDRRS